MIYTKLNNDQTRVTLTNSWKGISPTKATLQKRAVMKSSIDDFATFSWRGIKAWDVFGAFIISEKAGDLKFYNGPSFSNDYSNPMYDTHKGHLMGVNFKQQTIQFKVGMYWFNIEDYRKFLNWLDPYEVNYLTFDYDTEYSYLVKLASIADSPRYVIGKETNEAGQIVYQYYTELTLNWEIQGESIARSTLANNWTNIEDSNDWITTSQSDLSRPFVIDFNYYPNLELSNHQVSCIASYNNGVDSFNKTLFTIIFDHKALVSSGEQSEFYNSNNEPLSEITNIDETDLNSNVSDYVIRIRYDSETGLLFHSNMGDTWELLSLTTATTKGINLVSSLLTSKFLIPGVLENEDFDIADFKLSLVSNEINNEEVYITSYSRTNIA